MDDISTRLAQLSPEKRELALKKLREQNKMKSGNNPMPLPPIRSAARGRNLPLSFAQERLWFVNQLDPASSVYNIPIAMRLMGYLQVPALEGSLNEIIRRHEVLRTGFLERDGRVVQVIAPFSRIRVSITDMEGVRPAERSSLAHRLLNEEASIVFDLTRAPLLRAMVLKLGSKEHILLLTVHHIAFDGWSTGILMRELAILYQAFGKGEASPLTKLPVQYADFAIWQRDYVQGEVLAAHLAYWKDQLRNAPEYLELPADHARPATQSFRGSEEKFVFPREISDAIRRWSQKENITWFMILLAAFKVLLYRYTCQSDMVVGMPVANRKSHQLENLIGFFVNMLVLRTDLSGNPTFQQVLGRVREGIFEAYEHQDLPFERLVEELQPKRDLSRHPLFQVAFAAEDQYGSRNDLHVAGLQIKHQEIANRGSRFDLCLMLSVTEYGLQGVLEYNTDIFEKHRILRLIEHFKELLTGIALDPKKRISELPVLNQAEKQRLLIEFNATETVYPADKTVQDLFAWQANSTPNHTALRFPLNLEKMHQALQSDETVTDLSAPWEKCCFTKSKYLHALDVAIRGRKNPLTLVKTAKHDNVLMNINTYRLLDLFDGKHDIQSVFSAVEQSNASFFIFPVKTKDLLEITYDLQGGGQSYNRPAYRDFIALVKTLYRNHIIAWADFHYHPGPETKEDKEQIRFEEEESFDPRMNWERLLTRPEHFRKAAVLFLGDTPGMPSTGLLYLASYLERNGISSACQFYDPSSDFVSMKRNIEELLQNVQPRFVAVSLKWFPYLARVLDMCRIIKAFALHHALDIKIILGGNTASYYHKDLMRYPEIDYLIRGDGEWPLLKICRGETDIPNAVYRADGRIIENPVSYVQDEQRSGEIYLSHLGDILLSDVAPLLGAFFVYTHKGCNMNCFYCGGCRHAQEKTFNRKKAFIRAAAEVRKDILEIKPYASTFYFDFDAQADGFSDYCLKIWQGIDLSSKFCIFSSDGLPAPDLVALACKTFRYVYYDMDICTLSEPHRQRLVALKMVKPLPDDREILAFFEQCRPYDNLEIRINLIAGLPYLTADDLEAGNRLLWHILHTYSNLSELHWARLHAQPGAPVLKNAKDYAMHSLATTFEDFLKYSEMNFNQNDPIGELAHFHYPYIYFDDDRFNSSVSQHYAETNRLVSRHLEGKRSNVAIIANMSCRELDAKSNRLARTLRAKGVSRGSIVGILLDPCIEMPLALLAVLKAGAGFLPVNPDYPQDRIDFLLKDSQSALLLTQKQVRERFVLNGPVLDLEDEQMYESDDAPLADPNASRDIAYLIYTSGTTGRPKGVAVEHRSLVHYVSWFNKEIGLSEKDQSLLTSSYAFDLGYTSIFSALLKGCALHLVPKDVYLSAEHLIDYIQKQEITYLKITPSLLSTVVNSPAFSPGVWNRLRWVVVGGEPVHLADLEKLHATCKNLQVMNHYGPTEMTIGCIRHAIDFDRFPDYQKHPVIGRPVPNTKVYIVDHDCNLVPIGVPGELAIAGPGLARGYWNSPDVTAEKFVPNPYHPISSLYRSGDKGRWLEHGTIEFLGRMDNQIKIRGFRVELGEIENRLKKHEKVKEAVVVEKRDPGGNSHLCAYIIPREEDVRKNRFKGENDHEPYEEKNSYPPIVELFDILVKRHPQRICPVSSGKAVSYALLHHDIQRLVSLIWQKDASRCSLSKDEEIRYERQMLLDGWGTAAQEKIKNTTVFVAGAGGGASPTITQLALAGFGTIVVCDYDKVELSNLNRQFLHDDSRLGVNKALSAKETVMRINPHIRCIALPEKITRETVQAMVGEAAMIFDMLDNPLDKFILSECAVARGIPHIVAAMADMGSYAAVFHPPHSACYHCIFDKPRLETLVAGMKKAVDHYEKKPLAVSSSSLFVSTGFAVNEAMKILLGLENPAYNRFFFFNQRGHENIANADSYRAMTFAFNDHFRALCKRQGFDWEKGWRGNFLEELIMERNPRCPVCGTPSEIRKRSTPETGDRDGRPPWPEALDERRDNKQHKKYSPPSKGRKIALLSDHPLHCAIGLLGIFKSGGMGVPLNPKCSEKELADILKKAGVAVLLTDRENRNRCETIIQEVSENIAVIDLEEAREGIQTAKAAVPNRPDDVALELYTFDPKGVPAAEICRHRNLLSWLNLAAGSNAGEAKPSSVASCSDMPFRPYGALLQTVLPQGMGSTPPAIGAEGEDGDHPAPGAGPEAMDDFAALAAELKEYVSKALPEYMIPARFMRLKEIPLTPNGKIDKQALPESDESPAARRECLPPRNEIEKKMIGIWADILEMDPGAIGIDSDFFKLGGHSLTVTKMASRIFAELNVKIPLSDIFEKPFIKDLARQIVADNPALAVLEKDKKENPLLLKKGSDSAKNLFFIHAGSGEVDVYVEFCKYLDRKCSYWGFKAPRLKNYSPINITMEEIAGDYLKHMMHIQPHGPYLVAGWCIGGTIAFEIVRQLERLNEEVGFLALINTSPPDREALQSERRFSLNSELEILNRLPLEGVSSLLKGISEFDAIWPAVQAHLATRVQPDVFRNNIPPSIAEAIPNLMHLSVSEMIYYVNVIRTYATSRGLYIPDGKITSAIHFFSARQADVGNKKIWESYAKGAFHVYGVDGDHFSIFRVPAVIAFAQTFTYVLEKYCG